MEIDYDAETVRMDWHRYATDQVDAWADRVLEAAWSHGFRTVEFVHGAADVAARGTPGWSGGVAAGRGSTKELLRRRLYRGRWRRWVEEVRSGLNVIDEHRMVLALRENPKPDSKARWPVLPSPAHG
jgi:hypothetical protein